MKFPKWLDDFMGRHIISVAVAAAVLVAAVLVAIIAWALSEVIDANDANARFVRPDPVYVWTSFGKRFEQHCIEGVGYIFVGNAMAPRFLPDGSLVTCEMPYIPGRDGPWTE